MEIRNTSLNHRVVTLALIAATALAVTLAGGGFSPAAGQDPGGRQALEIMALSATTDVSVLRRLDAQVDALVRADALALASRWPDPSLPGHVHESFRQFHAGVPVYGGGLSRQLATGVIVSIFGTIYQALDLDTTPWLPPDEALALIEQQAGTGPATDQPPTLVILPTPRDTYVLAYHATMRNARTYFLDAHSGAIVHVEDEVVAQAAVGAGMGITGSRQKVSASAAGGGFEAYDRLRPAEIVTLDMRRDKSRLDALLDPRGDTWVPSDIARDADNVWSDPAVVDAHAYVGLTYDYLAQRQGWHGVDGRNGRILTLVNNAFRNAFYAPPPFGPEGTGAFVFGEEHDGTPIVSADVVAHELMHGVTEVAVRHRTGDGLLDHYTSTRGPSSFTVEGQTYRCDFAFPGPVPMGRRLTFLCDDEGRFRLLSNEGGAVHEAYSDIIGTAVEFSVHAPGVGPLRADYVMGEDTGRTTRSLEDPRAIAVTLYRGVFRYPDAMGRDVRFIAVSDGQTIYDFGVCVVEGQILLALECDNGGVHWNSTILSHAFYLAIEGGQNRATGRTVQGVGGANRHDVERAFFRAMTHLMPARTTFPLTAAVIRQSAVDLFGTDSATHRAVDQALYAVGL